MTELLRFTDVRCKSSGRTYSYTLQSGETRLLQLPSKAGKNAMIDCAIGETACSSGTIEIVQGERRHKKKLVIGKLGERRHHAGPLPLIWQPLRESRPGRVGWVAANGGLISNLRIWENVTLPLWYHTRREMIETEQSVIRWLDALGLEQDSHEKFMSAQPHDVEPWQGKLAGLLRVLVQAPSVTVVDAGLFDDVRPQLADLWITALENFASGERAVLAMADHATILPWEKIE